MLWLDKNSQAYALKQKQIDFIEELRKSLDQQKNWTLINIGWYWRIDIKGLHVPREIYRIDTRDDGILQFFSIWTKMRRKSQNMGSPCLEKSFI